MGDDAVRALAATRRLPPAALASLRVAFAAELDERLPRLRAAVAAGDAASLSAAVRDAHSLGSSAAVVGEAEASTCARAAEAALLRHAVDGDPRDLAAVRTAVDALTAALAGWAP